MKKIISILSAVLTTLALTVNVAAAPYSNGGVIGDMIWGGGVSGYRSLLTVFGTDEKSNMLALGRSANNSYIPDIKDGAVVRDIYTEDVYAVTSYRCGNSDDTRFFDTAIPMGLFDNNDYAIYRIIGNELRVPEISTEYFAGDSVVIYSYDKTTGSLGYEYVGKITAVADGFLTYTSNLDYYSAEQSNSDYLAPVYTEKEEIIGFLISDSEIITVTQIEKLMNSQHYTPLANDEPVQNKYAPPYDLGVILNQLTNKVPTISWFILIAILILLLSLLGYQIHSRYSMKIKDILATYLVLIVTTITTCYAWDFFCKLFFFFGFFNPVLFFGTSPLLALSLFIEKDKKQNVLVSWIVISVIMVIIASTFMLSLPHINLF